MRRLKKNIYYSACGALVAVLAVVRQCDPSVMGENSGERNVLSGEWRVESGESNRMPERATLAEQSGARNADKNGPACQEEKVSSLHSPLSTLHHEKPSSQVAPRPHRIRGVHSYSACFPDVQDSQIVAARKWGVRPVRDRQQAEQRKSELVYVGSNPYYQIDRGMSHSIPYLVPRAADLLQLIGRSYLDSLAVKGVPLHRIIVTSVLRSENDVERLRKNNGNASDQSCHRFGTTFDIAYNRYSTVSPPGEHRRTVQNDTLKWVLSEVLRDIRQQQRCYIKYEVKQGCFHITTR